MTQHNTFYHAITYLQQVALSYLSDSEFKALMKLSKDNAKELFLFLLNDTTLPLDDNPLTFRKDFS